MAPGAVAMAFWGFSDAFIQGFSYWLMGVGYKEGTEKARAVGYFKLVQSFGWCAGFAISPVDRVGPIVQLFLTVGCCIGGVGLSLLELPGSDAEA